MTEDKRQWPALQDLFGLGRTPGSLWFRGEEVFRRYLCISAILLSTELFHVGRQRRKLPKYE